MFGPHRVAGMVWTRNSTEPVSTGSSDCTSSSDSARFGGVSPLYTCQEKILASPRLVYSDLHTLGGKT
jgi:hypothetical protein